MRANVDWMAKASWATGVAMGAAQRLIYDKPCCFAMSQLFSSGFNEGTYQRQRTSGSGRNGIKLTMKSATKGVNEAWCTAMRHDTGLADKGHCHVVGYYYKRALPHCRLVLTKAVATFRMLPHVARQSCGCYG